MDEVTSVIVAIALTTGLAFPCGLMVGYDKVQAEIYNSIQLCEKELPRNQTCGYRIETFVKEIK